MAALSEFGWEKKFEREQLLSRLLNALVQLTPVEEDYPAAMDYCLQRLSHHKFTGCNPTQVTELYESLEARFAANALFEKHKALQQLRERFLSLEIESTQIDFNHRVLSMLFWLARDPLHAPYRAKKTPVSQVDQPKTVEGDDQEEGSISSDNFQEELEVYSSGSDLSDWNLDEAEETTTMPVDSTAVCTLHGLDKPYEIVAAGQLGQCVAQMPELPVTAQYHSDVLPHAALHAARADDEGNSLVMQLVQLSALDLMADSDEPQIVATQEEMVKQVLNMLRGQEQPGPALVFHTLDGRFSLTPGVTLPSLTPSCLDNLLQPLLNCGAMAVRLRRLLECVQLGSSRGSSYINEYITLTPTLQAFTDCLGYQFHGVQHRIASLEAIRCRADSTQPPLSLLELQLLLDKDLQRVQLMHAVMESALPEGRMNGCESSAHLLSVLHNAMWGVSSREGPQGGEHTALMLQLFCCSLQPLCDWLQCWMFEGRMDDLAQEAFIASDDSVAVDSSAFWSSAYTERYTSEGNIAAPNFLAHRIHDILSTGKSLILLRCADDHVPLASRRPAMSHSHAIPKPAAGNLTGRKGPQTRLWEQTMQLVKTALLDVVREPACTGQLLAELPHSFQVPEVPHDLLMQRQSQDFTQRMKATAAMQYKFDDWDAWGGGRAGQEEGDDGREVVPFIVRGTRLAGSWKGSDENDDDQSECTSDNGSQLAVSERECGGSSEESAAAPSEMAEWVEHMCQRIEAGLGEPTGIGCTIVERQRDEADGLGGSVIEKQPWESLGKLIEDCTHMPAYSGECEAVDEEDGSGDAVLRAVLRGVRGGYMQWLLSLRSVTLPPQEGFLRNCVETPIARQADIISQQLLGKLVGDWGVLHELCVLRNTFLLAVPLLYPFTSHLFAQLNSGKRLASFEPHQLNQLLHASLPTDHQQAAAHEVPTAQQLSVSLRSLLDDDTASQSSGASSSSTSSSLNVNELSMLNLEYSVSWPLSMMVDDDVLQHYNDIMLFLLQVLWCQWSLEQLRGLIRVERESEEALSSTTLSMMMDLSHFVITLRSFVADRIMHGAWARLEKDLGSCRSLDEVAVAHQSFLDTVSRQCFLQRDNTWRLLEHALKNCLNMVLPFCQLATRRVSEGGPKKEREVRAMDTNLEQMRQEFKDRLRYFLKLLTARTLKVSGQSELQQLVMSLNFNGYYPEADHLGGR